MKRLILLFLLMSSITYANDDLRLRVESVFPDGTVVSAGNSTSKVFDLDTYKPVGFASIQLEIGSTGTAKVYHESSNDGVTYNTLDGASDIVTSMTVGSAIYQFDMPFARYFKIIVEETGSSNNITIDKAVICFQ